jgi:hypothetical protein
MNIRVDGFKAECLRCGHGPHGCVQDNLTAVRRWAAMHVRHNCAHRVIVKASIVYEYGPPNRSRKNR